MSAADFSALLPLMVLAGSVMLLLLVISFARLVEVVFTITVLTLVLTLALTTMSLGEEPWQVSHLLTIDGMARLLSILFLLAALATATLSRAYLAGRDGEQEEFYVLLLLASLGAMTMAAASHFATLLLGLEILSISLYILIGYSDEGHPPLEAAVKYLILSGVASTSMLFGIALIYAATGTLVLGELAGAALDLTGDSNYLAAGQALLLAGLAFKLSLVPFHMWTPDVYQGAPAPVAGFLATVSKGAVFAFLLRYVLTTDVLDSDAVQSLIALIAIASMVGGNLLALMQDNVKRILAYSSVAHLGYLLIGLLAVQLLDDPALAVEASLIYLAGYTLMTLTAFGVVTALSAEVDEAESIDAYEGLFWRRPVVATIMTIALLSLTGIPLTAGFIAKFYLFAAGVAGGMWVLLWALVLGSSLAVYYYLKIILTMAKPVGAGGYAFSRGALDSTLALTLLGVSLISFGVFPSPLIEMVRAVLGTTGG